MLWLLAATAIAADIDFRRNGFWHEVHPINEYYCGTAVAVEVDDPRALLNQTACAQDAEDTGRHVSFYCRLDPAKARRLISQVRDSGQLLALRPGCEEAPEQPRISFKLDKLAADRGNLNCKVTPSVCGLVDDRLITADYLVRLHEAATPIAVMVFARETDSNEAVRFRSPTRLSPPQRSGPWARVSANPCDQVPRVLLRFSQEAKPVLLAKLNELGEDAKTPCMGKPAYLVRDEETFKDSIVGLDGFRSWDKVTLPDDEGRLDDAERYQRLSEELAAHGDELEKLAPHAHSLANEELVFTKPYAERVKKVREGLLVEPRFER